MSQPQAAAIQKDWTENPRWKDVKRGYAAEDVVKLRGSVPIEHTLAKRGAEKLWKLETQMDQLREKAAKADPGKSKEYDAEADAIEKDLTPAMEALAEEEIRIQDSLAPKKEAEEALPTAVGSGKNRRTLTPQERIATTSPSVL